MLVHDDRRFFDAETQARLEAFMAARTLFPPELLTLADRAAAQDGLDAGDAERFLDLATGAFALSREPVDHDWYFHLERISSVAADIGGVPSTHINHLTPRVLDIDDLYARMQARGIAMIDEIQGPPALGGPGRAPAPDILPGARRGAAVPASRRVGARPAHCGSASARSSSVASP